MINYFAILDLVNFYVCTRPLRTTSSFYVRHFGANLCNAYILESLVLLAAYAVTNCQIFSLNFCSIL